LDALDAYPTRIPQRSTKPGPKVNFMTNTNTTLALLSSFTGAFLLLGTAASAEPVGQARVTKDTTAAISNAFEIAIGGGYTHGLGDIGAGMDSVEDLSSNGGGMNLEVGYRATPHLTLGMYASLSGYDAGSQVAAGTDMVVGANAGLKADWHFNPSGAVIDPWISLGAGYRGLWLGNENATEQKLQGVDLARLQVGVDFRLTRDIAITPYVAISAGAYLAKADAMTRGYEEIQDRKLNGQFSGGVMGRFDMFGSRN
jgi:hypothetical protein